MSKTTTLYLSMIVVFVVGLWAIVHVGRGLRAPHDISGTWAVAAPGGAESSAKTTLAVAQSGRFVKVKVDNDPPIDLVLHEQAPAGAGERLTFKNGPQELTVDTPMVGHAPTTVPYQFTLRGPVSGRYTAERDASAAKKTDAKH